MWEGFAQFDVPGMINVELLAPRQCAPWTLLFELMLEGGIGNPFLNVAVPDSGSVAMKRFGFCSSC